MSEFDTRMTDAEADLATLQDMQENLAMFTRNIKAVRSIAMQEKEGNDEV